MPRKPTGNPRGRPVGSGTLGPQTRFTVRIPTSLFERLEAFAEGVRYTRSAPQLARCVREALEHYLVCPDKRQTKNMLPSSEENNRQTINQPQPHENNNRQTINVPEIPAEPLAPTGEPIEVLDFDQTKSVLGKLCPRGLEYHGTGHSLRRRGKMDCHDAPAEREA
jgi:hypothetical protein